MLSVSDRCLPRYHVGRFRLSLICPWFLNALLLDHGNTSISEQLSVYRVVSGRSLDVCISS